MPSEDKRPEEAKGRIEKHSRGAGPATPEAVEARARELAVIDGRSPDDVREEDRVRARREMDDEAVALSTDEKRSDVLASSNPADMAVEAGHRRGRVKPADEQELAEEEMKEGVREAEHERMLQGENESQREGHDRL